MHPPPLFQDTCSISSILLFRSHPPNQSSSGDAKEGANSGAPAKRVSFSDYLNRKLHSNFVLPRALQLIEEFTKKENISFDGGQPAEVLLARDASPSGEALLEAAKQGICFVAGTIFHDMGILTSPQLHWLVHARNKGRKASEHDYFQHLSYSYRCLVDLIPKGATTDKVGESLVVDGANGVGGDKIEALKDLCDGLDIEICNTSKGGGILDQGVGVDFIQEQKIVPSGTCLVRLKMVC